MFSFFSAGSNILGMNARNLRYIRPHNLSQAKRLADDKIRSKKIMRKGKVPVPKLLGIITSRADLENFDWSSLPNGFALKPNRGLGGEGIIVVYGRKKGRDDAWVKASGGIITINDMKTHIQNILDGSYSLSGTPDVAFFEERLLLSKTLRPYSYRGIPDVRVIVYNKVPVMAMLRLPTKDSGGKANLQQGGIGVGIDLATGTTTTAVQGHGKVIDYVPNSRLLLAGIKIPYWDDILELAIKAQEVSRLGYLGADVAIDRERGPVFLELNARPGLEIQVANLAGLKRRLERVEGLKIKSAGRGVAVGKNLFGGEIEGGVEELSGKKVIGSVEKVKLIGVNNKEIDIDAKIDTGAFSTSVDTDLARILGFGKTIDAFNKIDLTEFGEVTEKGMGIGQKIEDRYGKDIPWLEGFAVTWASTGVTIRPIIKIDFVMDGVRVTTKVNIVDRAQLKFPMIIGKRNLRRFLVDVSK